MQYKVLKNTIFTAYFYILQSPSSKTPPIFEKDCVFAFFFVPLSPYFSIYTLHQKYGYKRITKTHCHLV